MSNNYTKIKNIFIETDDISEFVNLDKSTLAYHKIISALQKPLKLILFYGKPGTGKTFLLYKIKEDLEDKAKVVFFPQPFFDEKEFFNELFFKIFDKKSRHKIDGYESFMRIYQIEIEKPNSPVQKTEQVVILLDEAQFYPPVLIEKIRLMADSRLFKFLFTVHKTDEEDVLAKDYFKTRIWSSIELPNSTLGELKLYIEKKLMFHEVYPYFHQFSDENFNLIFHLTDGNLRNLNKLLYKIYEICEYYEENRPTELSPSSFSDKIIEMAAISAGLINA